MHSVHRSYTRYRLKDIYSIELLLLRANVHLRQRPNSLKY